MAYVAQTLPFDTIEAKPRVFVAHLWYATGGAPVPTEGQVWPRGAGQ